MTQAIQKTLRDSAGMRWTALLLLALAMFCSYIFMDILSPIKNLMQETRGWDSTAFGTMQGSEVFLNVFVFFLIFAGIILDKMGVRFTAVLSAAVMLVGAIIKWYAVSESFMGSGLETWFTNNLNDLRLRLRDGWYHRLSRNCQMVQGSRNGVGYGFRNGVGTSGRCYMYDFLAVLRKVGWRNQCQP